MNNPMNPVPLKWTHSENQYDLVLRQAIEARQLTKHIIHPVNINFIRNIDYDLAVINYFLKGTDFAAFDIVLQSALQVQEIDPCLATSVLDIVNHLVVWRNEPLSLYTISPRQVKLLRWLLVSYTGAALWNQLAMNITMTVRVTNDVIENGDIETVPLEELLGLKSELEYFKFMLLEDSYFDIIGGPLLSSEEESHDRNLVICRARGFTTFTKEKASQLVVQPGDLLVQMEDALFDLRTAMSSDMADGRDIQQDVCSERECVGHGQLLPERGDESRSSGSCAGIGSVTQASASAEGMQKLA